MNIMDIYSLQDIINYVLNKYPDSYFSRDLRERYYKHYSVEDYLDKLEEFFSCDILDLCGCGTPENTSQMLKEFLQIMYDFKVTDRETYDWHEEQKRTYDMCRVPVVEDSYNTIYEGLIQYLQYTLDSAGILEHGSSISSAWLTELGEMFLWVLNKKYGKDNKIMTNDEGEII